MKVQKLDDSVINQIKYHLYFNSIDIIVETILQKCFSSNATKISIKIDLQSAAVFVQSNDVGYTPDQLEELATSEKFGGLKVISNITIVSKSKEYKCPYKITPGKTFLAQLCNETDLKGSYFKPGPIGDHGTIHIVSSIFNNLPVRQAQLKATPIYKIVNDAKLALLKVLFRKTRVYVSLELYNSQQLTFEEILSTNAASDVKLLQDLYDIEIQFQPVKATFKSYQIDGIIGFQTISSKMHQYVFINNKLRSLSRTDITTFNNIFEDFGEQDPSPRKKMIHKYPTFLISVTCDKDVTEGSYSWLVVFDILKRIFTKFVRMGQLKQPTNKHEITFLSNPKRAKTDKFILNTNVRWGGVNNREIEGMVSCGKSQYLKPQLQPPDTKKTTHKCDHDHVTHKSNEYENIQFDRLHLPKYRIIKQIDKKFILLVIDFKLVVLDQHAADERIKVEELMQEFVTNMPRNLRLAQPIRIKVSSSEHLLLQQYRTNFKFWGIIYHSDEENDDLVITNVPELFINSSSDAHFIKSILIQHCYDLQNNIKSQIFEATSSDWFTIMHHVPQSITNLINSRACRSAIMFGDELTMTEMHELVEKLSRCKLPFYCAHGRPSIVPLVNLHSNE